jgi:AcrR family transcriptional regulator
MHEGNREKRSGGRLSKERTTWYVDPRPVRCSQTKRRGPCVSTTDRSIGERERLLGLTAQYLLEHGVLDLRLRTLGEAIGSSHRVLLYYFDSREQLVSEALDEAARVANVRDTRLLGAPGTGPVEDELLRAWRLISRPEQLPLIRLFMQVVAIALHDEQRYAGFLEGLQSEWTGAYRDFLESHHVPEEEARSLSIEIVGLQRGLQFELALGGSSELLDRSFAAAAERWSSRIASFSARRVDG